MNDGKITIESGEQKAIININNKDEEEASEVTINFEPELNLKNPTADMHFVGSVAAMFLEILKGGNNANT